MPFVLGVLSQEPIYAQQQQPGLFRSPDLFEQLRDSLEPEHHTRLPDSLYIDFGSSNGDDASITPIASEDQKHLQRQVRSCSSPKLRDCLEGSITTYFSPAAATELERHRLKAYPITLSTEVEGYLIPSEIGQLGQATASVMWRQDGQYYRIQFPDSEKQNILYMAHSMANVEPITQESLVIEAQKYQRSSTISQVASPQTNQEYWIHSTPNKLPLEAYKSSIESVEDFPKSLISSDESIASRYLKDVKELRISNSEFFETVDQLKRFNAYIRNNPEKQIQHLITHITEEYVKRGFITSAISNEEKDIELQDGMLVLQAREGEINNLKVCWINERSFKRDYVVDRIKVGIGTPLNYNDLENALRLLKADPRFQNVEATIRESASEKEDVAISSSITESCDSEALQHSSPTGRRFSDLTIKVQEAKLADLSFSVNNYAPPSVGSQRLEASFLTRTLWGKEQDGDELQANVALTRKLGIKNLDLSYRRPFNAMQGTLEARATLGETKVVQEPFDELDIRGTSQRYELNFRQPVIRRYDEELALTTGFTYQSGQTFLFENLPSPFGFGPDEDGISRTSTFKFGQSYVKRDPKGAWSLGSQFNLGVGWLDATVNEAPVPDSRFFSWLGLAQRSQRLGDNHLLVFQSELQLTPNSLLPSQQFVIGGAQSVRGYRQNARSGDNGFRVRLEDRITVKRDGAGRPTVQLIPFWDMGSVWNLDSNPNQPPKQRFLSSLGLGAQWDQAFDVEGLTLRFDYGIPLNQLNEPEKTLQDSGFHFGLSYQRAFNLGSEPSHIQNSAEADNRPQSSSTTPEQTSQ